MGEKIKTLILRFPQKKTLIWGRYCSIGQSCCSITWKRSIGWFLEVLGAWSFSAERSLNQPKTMRVCFRSTNQSSRSISVRLLLLFCSRFYFKVIRKSLDLIWLYILTPKLQMKVRRGAGSAIAIAIATPSTTQITAEVMYALTSNTAGQGPARGIQQPHGWHKCYVRYRR